jgi:hypothetical protein
MYTMIPTSRMLPIARHTIAVPALLASLDVPEAEEVFLGGLRDNVEFGSVKSSEGAGASVELEPSTPSPSDGPAGADGPGVDGPAGIVF